MNVTVRTESLFMLVICGLTGVWFAATRGFWPAAPLLVIACAGVLLHLLPPIPREQPGRTRWANANLVALVVALAATWFESAVMLLIGMVLVAVTLAVPQRERKS